MDASLDSKRVRLDDPAFAVAMRTAPIGMAVIRPDGGLRAVNPALSSMTGFTEQQLLASGLSSLTHPDDRGRAFAVLGSIASGDITPHPMAVRCVHRRGHAIWTRISAAPMPGGYVLAYIADITSDNRVEEALKESQRRFQLVVDGTREGVWDWKNIENKTELQYWSPQLYALLGYAPGEIPPTYETFQTILHPDDLAVTEAAIRAHFDRDAPYDVEFRFQTKSGVYKWFRARGTKSINNDGSFRFTGSCANIEERKQAESQAQNLLSFQNLILNTIPDLLFVKDNEHRFIMANRAFLHLYPEDKRDRVLGNSSAGDYEPDEEQAFLEQDRIAFETGHSLTREEIRFPNGQVRVLLMSKTRFEGPNGQPLLLAVGRDVTELEETQDSLDIANKEIDTFAYVASHDLKAPLRGIDTLAEWIEEDLNNRLNDKTRDHLIALRARVRRLETMLDDILAYSRAGRIVEEARSIDLNRLLADIVETLTIPAGFTVMVAPDMPTLVSPRTPLEQVFANLIWNAILHHDRDEGRVDVSWRPAADRIEVAIADDGPGIPLAFRERVFAMFQTLQPRHRKEGSGLGLSIVRKLVEWQGGAVWVEDRSDGERGTIIRFTWPKSSG